HGRVALSVARPPLGAHRHVYTTSCALFGSLLLEKLAGTDRSQVKGQPPLVDSVPMDFSCLVARHIISVTLGGQIGFPCLSRHDILMEDHALRAPHIASDT